MANQNSDNHANLDVRVSVIETKVDAFIQEMRDFKTEMRDRDNQRAAEIRELRQKQESDISEIRASITNLNTKIDNVSDHVRNLAVTAMIGIGAMVVGVIGIAYSVITALK